MSLQTSEYLRVRYRELVLAFDTKTAKDEDMNDLMRVCRILTERGYVLNADSSDWVLALSSKQWKLEDET